MSRTSELLTHQAEHARQTARSMWSRAVREALNDHASELDRMALDGQLVGELAASDLSSKRPGRPQKPV
jgi:hypothetical protein